LCGAPVEEDATIELDRSGLIGGAGATVENENLIQAKAIKCNSIEEFLK